MKNNGLEKKRFLEIRSPLGEDKLFVTAMKGTEKISGLFNYELEMFSSDLDIKPIAILNKPISIQLNSENQSSRYFHGIVNRFHIGHMQYPNGRFYKAELVPWLWFLTRTLNCRIYQEKTVKTILEEVFKSFGFSDYSMTDITTAHKARLYCVQYQETAFDFISRLLSEAGIFYYFRHEKEKHVMVLADTAGAYKDVADNPISYNSGSYPGNHIDSWERQYDFGTGQATQGQYDFERPSTDLTKSTATLVNLSGIEHYEHYEYKGSFDAAHPADAQTKLHIEANDSQFEIIHGAGQHASFFPGTKFRLNVAETEVNSVKPGIYLLTQVTHEVVDSTRIAGAENKANYYNNFICIPDGTVYRPPQAGQKPRIYGLQTATVVGPPKEEIFTDKYGRVKVQFHWDRVGKKDDKSSCWIRLAQIVAGNQWGSIFIPRIGQEVIVAFLEGDPEQPLIVGSVYNAEQLPPYLLPDNSTRSGVKTHSFDQGEGAAKANELYFEDKKNEEAIYLHAQKDFIQSVEHDDSLEVKNNQTITITKDRTITVTEGNETTTIQKGNRIVLVESGNVTETVKTGDRQIEVNVGDNTLLIKQGNQVTNISLGKSTIEAAQGIELKVGSNSIKIDQSGISIQGLKINITGTLVEVKADASLKLSGIVNEVSAEGMLKIEGALTTIN